MFKLFPNPDQLITLDTQQRLTLATPHLFRVISESKAKIGEKGRRRRKKG